MAGIEIGELDCAPTGGNRIPHCAAVPTLVTRQENTPLSAQIVDAESAAATGTGAADSGWSGLAL